MKKMFLATLAFTTLVGCATTSTKIDSAATSIHNANGRILVGAARVNRVTDRVIKRAGPLVLTGVCVLQPQYCEPAKAAYSMAKATHNEITRMISGLTLVQEAEYGTKLATLYQQFQLQIDEVNTLIAKYGGEPLDMTEFNAAVAAAQTQ